MSLWTVAGPHGNGVNKIRIFQPMMGFKISPRWQKVIIVGFLIAVFWLVRYRYSAQFGLYEDDLTIIPSAVHMTFLEVLKYIGWYIVTLQGHMRPLSDSFIYLISNIGWRLGGLSGLYLMGFLVETINICLLFTLVDRLSDLRLASLITLAYVLYSVDTTLAFLTHSLGIHPSITLLLLSLHCYLSNRRVLSYILAFLILFSYETPFPLFFVAPLLAAGPWDKRRWTRLGVHVLIVALMLIGVLVFRKAMGDPRVSGLSLTQMATTPLTNILHGITTNVTAYGVRVGEVLKNMDNRGVLLFSLGGLVVVGAFLLWMPDEHAPQPVGIANLPGTNRPLLRLALAGLLMLALAYTMTLTTPPTFLFGRATRAHTAAGIGTAFCCGIAACWLLELLKKMRVRLAGIALIALVCAPLFGFGVLVQVDYVRAWRSQQQFWTSLLPLISDAGPGDVVLVEPGIFYGQNFIDTNHIDANTWNMPRVLDQLYNYPFDYIDQPQVFRLRPGWDASIVNPDGSLKLSEGTVIAPSSLYRDVDPSHVIFIANDEGSMKRLEDSFSLGDHVVHVKAFDSRTVVSYSQGLLYKLMILDTP
jgi:hypothetical protein